METTMSILSIETLIAQSLEAQRQAEDARRADLQQQANDAATQLKARIQQAVPEIVKHLRGKAQARFDRDGLAAVYFDVDGAPLRLANFCFVWRPKSRVTRMWNEAADAADDGVRVVETMNENYSQNFQTLDHLPEFLLARRAEFEKQEAKRIADELENLPPCLTMNYRSGYCRTEEEARQVYARLVELDAARVAKWDAVLAEWFKDQAERERSAELARQQKIDEEAATEQRRQALEKATSEYRVAYTAYGQQLQAARAANAAEIERVRALYDRPYAIARLTYAVVAQAEGENEPMIDREQAWVMAITPERGVSDPSHYWPVIRGHEIRRTWFRHVVSVEAPIETTARTAPKGAVGSVKTDLGPVAVAPGTDPQAVRAEVHATPDPDEPERPLCPYHDDYWKPIERECLGDAAPTPGPARDDELPF